MHVTSYNSVISTNLASQQTQIMQCSLKMTQNITVIKAMKCTKCQHTESEAIELHSIQQLHLCSTSKISRSSQVTPSYFHWIFTCNILANAILSVSPSITWVDQSKTVQARITKSSPSAGWKTLVSGTVKLFHKFEKGHPKQGAKWEGGKENLRLSADMALSERDRWVRVKHYR